MSTSAERDLLEDILNAAKGALEYVGGISKQEFRQRQKDRDGVNYKFIVIGEATNKLGRDFHALHPQVPWSDMIAMRNIVAHQYGRVDPDIVWDAVNTRLEPIIAYIEPLVRGPGNDDPGDLGGGGGSGCSPAGKASAAEGRPPQPPRSAPERLPPSKVKKSTGWER